MKTKDGAEERSPDRPAAPARRPGGAQPEHRTGLSGLNGLGGMGEKRQGISPDDFYPVQM